jgi:hypothetical protein
MNRLLLLSFVLLGACVAPGPDGTPDPLDPPPLSPAESVDIDNYRRLMEEELFTWLGDDRGFGPEHDLARDNIEAELASLGLDVALEPFSWEDQTFHNVVATAHGAAGPDDVIVVGAHFDSMETPGADDNATGTALVLEMARIFSGFELERTVVFVAFDREEQGRFGSKAFVAEHGAGIDFALTADMIGQDHGAFAHDLFSTAASLPRVEAFAAAIEEHGGGLEGRPITGDVYGFSDHESFELEGIPAFVIIEADYTLNTHYHEPTDAIDQYEGYIDYDYVEALLEACAGFLGDEAGAT